ncbi:helix-turn-helix transcriptional regulator [Hydrogenovibrio marinus]|uniref:Transcriptional regulator n=1 Tax=Hydrogenovibrio marinus TaxID=28885 RepID=A0A067A1J8_HYDMR|nr:WYL domain-containing protein [Hydrogenovibrio marinus]KDN96190.1 transcriptional regulator [Hydrogenovibrio marinus]BBN60632.1 hypothetical protein HVMH_2226 [Hydrogenovibrio marinus]
MNEKQDTAFRLLALLQAIPRYPHTKSTTNLRIILKQGGFDVSMRMLQRDLDKLSYAFPIICDDSSKPYQWSFEESFQSSLPALDTTAALVWVLAEEHLRHLLPSIAMEKLNPTFEQAKRFLDAQPNNQYGNWRAKIKALPNGKALIPAKIDEAIWHNVSEAVLSGVVVIVDYLSRESGEVKSRKLHPLGLVDRHTTTYLVAWAEEYAEIRQFAVHRIQSIELTNVPVKVLDDFSIANYAQSGAFDMPIDNQSISLEILIDNKVAWHLKETPISQDQIITETDDPTRQHLKATVSNDEQTQWWLMGFGSKVEVLAPKEWREAIYQHALTIIQRNNK